MMSFVLALEKFVYEHGNTVNEVCRASGVHRDTLEKARKKGRRLSPATMEKISGAYGIEEWELLREIQLIQKGEGVCLDSAHVECTLKTKT